MDKTADLRPNAWLLDFGQMLRAAVGMRVLMQVIEDPHLQAVPCTPAHCHSVLPWQGKLLPVVDVAAMLGEDPQQARLLAIAGYQEYPGAPTRLGAFLLTSPPVAIIVGDDQACALPDQPESWKSISVSCFGHQGDAIPVLHLPRIFARRPDAK